jgi:hypothetical protein
LAAAGSEIVLNGFAKPEDVADAQAKIALPKRYAKQSWQHRQ